VEYNFRQRWNAAASRKYFQRVPLVHTHPVPEPVESESVVQVARTIPRWTYHFEPKVAQGIAQLYTQAIRQARRFIYLENQYLWVRAYTGLDIPFLGKDSPEMELIVRELIDALRRGVTLAITLPDHPAPGRAFTDAVVARIRQQAPEAVAERRFLSFCLGASQRKGDREHYRPIYVHAKVAIVDDSWTTIGSANLNNRGLRDDTEINVAVLDARFAQALRFKLWAEHLGQLSADELFAFERYLANQPQFQSSRKDLVRLWRDLRKNLDDPLAGLRLLDQQAGENLRRYKAGQSLSGHLLPYLLADEARAQGLNFRESHGWLEEE